MLPVVALMLESFPFVICCFHSDGQARIVGLRGRGYMYVRYHCQEVDASQGKKPPENIV
ncbi:MAG: hypothetical protein FWC38_03275 [Proteobacteria bacterium]|nr:hypothetical protein [Pseudomonadota bacterium]MCL2307250.1 hypothetical protein [Pseudomonadota bacterium]